MSAILHTRREPVIRQVADLLLTSITQRDGRGSTSGLDHAAAAPL
jgi:hypothetical protein